MVSFIGFMGIDEINSYLAFFPKAPHLYEPRNWLRLTTGTMNGLAMSGLVFPVISGSLWPSSQTKNEPAIKSFKELLYFLLGAGATISVVLWRHPFLLYPLALLSTFGVLVMLTIVGPMFVLLATRRQGYAHSGMILYYPPPWLGLAVTFMIISGMNGCRTLLMKAAGLPF